MTICTIKAKTILLRRWIVDENSNLVVLNGRKSLSGGMTFTDDAGHSYIVHGDDLAKPMIAVDRIEMETYEITGQFASYSTIDALNDMLPPQDQFDVA